MADPKRDQKTEDPTPRRKKKNRSEGRVARSPDIGSSIALFGLYLVVRYLLPAMGRALGSFTRTLLATLSDSPDPDLLEMMIGPTLIAVLGPPVALSVVLAITAGVGQTRGVLSPKALKPKWSRLSPKQGIDKFKPKTMAFETLRVILKTALLIGVLWVPIEGIIARAPATRGVTDWIAFASNSIATVLLWAAALATVIAAIDYTFKRRKLTGETKMTRQEIRDESKDSEGDPQIRQARKERARELSRNRMIADVTTADVLLVNPIRFAVALKYVEDEGAPKVVARGAGKFAQRLRQEAYRNGVIVKQDIPLTRALYRRCRVGQFVPAELYEAVAVVLAAVYRRRALRRVAA
ncbi:MAG: EscU/YscU/HrcU family type III secretion system export apparatus switch protein [Actinomycetota bacterium]|jgi:flagellar biosynthesis protein FlhB|nr:EscU/YscU/HrcU family type III secretion system export apparatus switch protein [Actinomycetota bacterium]